MTLFRRFCCSILAAVFALPLVPLSGFAQSNADLTGFWVLHVPTGDGNIRDSFFELKQEGTALSGDFLFGPRKAPFTDGTIQDGKLHFVVTFGQPPRSTQRTYDGVIEGDKIAITYTVPGRDPITGTAERSRPEAALPPPPQPLEALHDVPDNGMARTPPMGWNSWNKFAGKIDDAAVRGMADAMVTSGMRDAGYIYINIDDTWEGPRDADGNITSNRKFPDMKALADYVHSKGLKIGIYSSPGPKTCAGYEGTFNHEAQDAKTWAAWGFDYIKYDWCSDDRIYKDEDMQPIYQKMGEALAATGRPIVYSLCQYGRNKVWEWGAKVGGNLWRTTGDISDNWRSMSNIGFRQFDIAPYIKPGHWNDPDMLEIGNGGMTADEYRTHMSLWSLLAAPLLAGNDLRNMTDETKSILMNREVIAIDQDPAGLPSRRISEPDATAVIVARPLKDGSTAVGLFNRGDQPQEITATFANLGITAKKLKGRDLWQHADVKLSGPSYTATVPSHGVVMVRISKK